MRRVISLLSALALAVTALAGAALATPAGVAAAQATADLAGDQAAGQVAGQVGHHRRGGGGDRGRGYKVLVFTRARGERHVSTAAGVAALRALARRHRFSVEVTDDPDAFTERNLGRYRAVVFLNTSGDVLDAGHQAAFEAYFGGGGGFVGIHSAIETEPEWDFLTEILGTRATGASRVARATVEVTDRVHEASADLPESWRRTDQWYDFATSVRGQSHVLATVDEATYDGGTMGFDHPVAWCADRRGGRSFYTAGGHTPSTFADPAFRSHLAGAIRWAAGVTDPVTSDCGATVLANYRQVKLSAPPNLNEPVGFDVLPDGRVIQTARGGQVRLHDPAAGTSTVIATIDVYAHSEDGLYGPAIDRDFARNKWVYLYYSPREMEAPFPPSTPPGNAPALGADLSVWDPWQGYFQLSRFKFVDGPNPTLDLASEQKILKVPVNRGACCHVAGDIDFDEDNNLWLVTGDDTPAGGGSSGGFGPFNDQLTPDGLFQAPHVDARRSSLNTNDLRGKVLRIRVRPDGSYTVPRGNLFKPGTPRTRPEIYAMGFRNPFRIQVDSDGVAYVTDYSPDSRVPQRFRGPAGVGRVMVVRKPANYGWPLCYAPDLPYYRWDFNASAPLDSPPRTHECDNPRRGPANTSRHNTGLTFGPPIARPEVWYSYLDNNEPNPLGTPCFAAYGPDPLGTCPQLFPALGPGGGVGPHGAVKYEFDRRDPNPTKFPPYYDQAVFFAEWTRDYLREIRLDRRGDVLKINDTLSCGPVQTVPTTPFECDNPMDIQFHHGHLYLLTYGDGFFTANPDAGMYRWEYVKGPSVPSAVAAAAPAGGAGGLAVAFSSAGSSDPDQADSIRFEWDLDGDGGVDSTDPNPTFTYPAPGTYTAELTVIDAAGHATSAAVRVRAGTS